METKSRGIFWKDIRRLADPKLIPISIAASSLKDIQEASESAKSSASSVTRPHLVPSLPLKTAKTGTHQRTIPILSWPSSHFRRHCQGLLCRDGRSGGRKEQWPEAKEGKEGTRRWQEDVMKAWSKGRTGSGVADRYEVDWWHGDVVDGRVRTRGQDTGTEGWEVEGEQAERSESMEATSRKIEQAPQRGGVLGLYSEIVVAQRGIQYWRELCVQEEQHLTQTSQYLGDNPVRVREERRGLGDMGRMNDSVADKIRT
ncbi:hypothetical protein DFH08DRAFT_825670 [Mycena albidolilacea]|uniref:Uncharacterized protein n=1 Tax=Mycena albidolilacea TaxID=1033008 RepID=A0AAD6Z2L1_9AGAR|nr:hypothetical protein DFH08DRAFT_825670 [Mycena albidolilacea]